MKDGELVRRVAPPYPECRAEYFIDRTREHFKWLKTDPPESELARDYTDYFTKFGWTDGWTVPALIAHTTPVKPDEGESLARVLESTTGFQRTRFDGDADLLGTEVTGDWVVRAGAEPDKLVTALEKVLRKECDLRVTLAIKEEEREVYVLSGTYATKPLAERKDHEIEVYATDLHSREYGGGGSGRLQELAEHVEGWIATPIVLGEIEAAPKRVSWHYNERMKFTNDEYAEDHDPAKVMANVAAQTGLTAKLEKRKIKVLVAKKGS